MSGSSNSGGGGGGNIDIGPGIGNGGAASLPDCNNLKINTRIGTPNPAIMPTIRVGDILYVSLDNIQGPVTVRTAMNALVGAIVGKAQMQLIRCISNGAQYFATVIDINEGSCQVLIEHR